MQEPAIFRVVSGDGEVHAEKLTSTAAYAMATFLVTNRNLPGIRTELMDAPEQSAAPVAAPHIVAAATPLPDIEPGKERDALREAIEAQLDASARLDAANQAVERASAFVAARQSELDAMTAAHKSEIEASGANLAEALKSGGASFDASRVIDRGPVLDAEVRRDTAKAALEQLVAEQTESDAAYKAAETAVRLAVMAVKRADVEAMVKRLEDVKAEFTALATAIDAAQYSDVPATFSGQQAMRIEIPSPDTAAKVWHRYSAALRDDPEAAREDFA
ncbi:hypothetical protein VSR69_33070 [Paraburkholderia phytofirmans]|uniref:hypothetical protein n=1 Tax=Paraburkholderia sp. BL9I2N2 TaxID=1938809 RepID=UPI001046B822|nr:hypothetical protein [Paraburkholderia sp. BL9I2N2]TCK96006.1 hypothetical protein B0G74_2649 [Paraburkholderia sp. BL9I2N2]